MHANLGEPISLYKAANMHGAPKSTILHCHNVRNEIQDNRDEAEEHSDRNDGGDDHQPDEHGRAKQGHGELSDSRHGHGN